MACCALCMGLLSSERSCPILHHYLVNCWAPAVCTFSKSCQTAVGSGTVKSGWHAAGWACQIASLGLWPQPCVSPAGGTEALQADRRLCSPQGHPYHALHSGRQHAGQFPIVCLPLITSILRGCSPALIVKTCSLPACGDLWLTTHAGHASGCWEPVLCWACQCGSSRPLHLLDFTACWGCRDCCLLNPSAARPCMHRTQRLTLHMVPTLCTPCCRDSPSQRALTPIALAQNARRTSSTRKTS